MSYDQEDERLDKLAELWRLERETCRRRHLEERAETTLDERVEQGSALARLQVADTAAAPGERLLLWLSPPNADVLDAFRAGPGSPVVLWQESPAEDSAVQAVIARRKSDRLGVMVDADALEVLADATVHLDLEAPQTTFERGERAVDVFRHAAKQSDQGQLRAVLFGGHAALARNQFGWTVLDDALNQAQRQAVDQALCAEHVALVHGPPGTGKTRTLVEVVRQAVADKQRVLVSAASNAAVDNLAERLIEAGVDLVRVGHPARVAPAVEARSLDALLEATADYKLAQKWMDQAREIRRRIEARSKRNAISRAERSAMYRETRQLWGDAHGHLRRVQQAIIDRSPVICATAAGADTKLLDDQVFDLVVLDEATQAADPIALVAMLRAPKVVMAGDPHQLAPTVIDNHAEREGLGVTFLERLCDQAVMLEVQHRMHRHLMRFPSETKYDGKLVAADVVANHTLDDLDGVALDPARPGPLVFLDTAGKGWDEERSENDPSTSNPGQAARTAAEVRRLLSRGVRARDIGVITPYFAQVRRLRKLLLAVDCEDLDGLEIDTVDGFQGREKEAVVVDLVRSNPDGELGFLKDTRRMNVALTRARRFLLVIGDSATLSTHPYYAAFLESVEAHGAWISAWTDDAQWHVSE